MANELLDFVMSVVRDPAVATRYAENPAQTIADANLTDVTTADVNGLIPVVKESLSMGGAVGDGAGGIDGNVWASGAANSAFDAFDHLPEQAVPAADDVAGTVVDTLGPVNGGTGLQSVASGLDAAALDAAALGQVAPADDFNIGDAASALDETATRLVADTPDNHDAPSFDIFD